MKMADRKLPTVFVCNFIISTVLPSIVQSYTGSRHTATVYTSVSPKQLLALVCRLIVADACDAIYMLNTKQEVH